ncbi:MAG TPA: HU family DNA-binding protein [Gammaproteobacteria bacterium]|nr:HU family DNA-binding protein [Xanthomonadales bacterium]MCB1593487.1 HU family DNA-binding protein [Xanthomonadales bacterium]HPI96359.1 HU family DNA-binding protein [Gammaproteobacteria bacterium]HPQ87773.1 HU family DNA-binding protein [Gammaproteobacteria bacterium]
MKKADFIKQVAENAGVSQATANSCLEAMIGTVTECLKDGDSLTFVGFGTFSVKERAARKGRNPRTGATIDIKASKVPTFKAGKALKDALN